MSWGGHRSNGSNLMDTLTSIEAFRTVVDSDGFKHGLRPETQNRTDLNASCQGIHRSACHAACDTLAARLSRVCYRQCRIQRRQRLLYGLSQSHRPDPDRLSPQYQLVNP
jgi:hypothetical protein